MRFKNVRETVGAVDARRGSVHAADLHLSRLNDMRCGMRAQLLRMGAIARLTDPDEVCGFYCSLPALIVDLCDFGTKRSFEESVVVLLTVAGGSDL